MKERFELALDGLQIASIVVGALVVAGRGLCAGARRSGSGLAAGGPRRCVRRTSPPWTPCPPRPGPPPARTSPSPRSSRAPSRPRSRRRARSAPRSRRARLRPRSPRPRPRPRLRPRPSRRQPRPPPRPPPPLRQLRLRGLRRRPRLRRGAPYRPAGRLAAARGGGGAGAQGPVPRPPRRGGRYPRQGPLLPGPGRALRHQGGGGQVPQRRGARDRPARAGRRGRELTPSPAQPQRASTRPSATARTMRAATRRATLRGLSARLLPHAVQGGERAHRGEVLGAFRPDQVVVLEEPLVVERVQVAEGGDDQLLTLGVADEVAGGGPAHAASSSAQMASATRRPSTAEETMPPA